MQPGVDLFGVNNSQLLPFVYAPLADEGLGLFDNENCLHVDIWNTLQDSCGSEQHGHSTQINLDDYLRFTD